MDPVTLAALAKFLPQLMGMGKDAKAKMATTGATLFGAGTDLLDSFIQSRKARKIENAYKRPVYTPPAAVQEAVGLARNAYNAPNPILAQMTAENRANGAQSARALVNSGATGADALAGIAGVNANMNSANRQAIVQGQTRGDSLRNNLESELGNLAGDQRTAFKYNKDAPFEAAMATAAKLRETAHTDLNDARNVALAGMGVNASITQGSKFDPSKILEAMGIGKSKSAEAGAGIGSVGDKYSAGTPNVSPMSGFKLGDMPTDVPDVNQNTPIGELPSYGIPDVSINRNPAIKSGKVIDAGLPSDVPSLLNTPKFRGSELPSEIPGINQNTPIGDLPEFGIPNVSLNRNPSIRSGKIIDAGFPDVSPDVEQKSPYSGILDKILADYAQKNSGNGFKDQPTLESQKALQDALSSLFPFAAPPVTPPTEYIPAQKQESGASEDLLPFDLSGLDPFRNTSGRSNKVSREIPKQRSLNEVLDEAFGKAPVAIPVTKYAPPLLKSLPIPIPKIPVTTPAAPKQEASAVNQNGFTAEEQAEFSALNKMMRAGNLKPGSPEYNRAVVLSKKREEYARAQQQGK